MLAYGQNGLCPGKRLDVKTLMAWTLLIAFAAANAYQMHVRGYAQAEESEDENPPVAIALKP